MTNYLTQLQTTHLEGGLQMDELFSVEEAARRLGGLSKYTIHAWLSQGKLMRTKVGRRTMIRASELQRVIEDGGKSPANRSGLSSAA
jgi:excisionase family DNA binding protein